MRKIDHCGAEIHINCTIPVLSIMFEKYRSLRDRYMYYLHHTPSVHVLKKLFTAEQAYVLFVSYPFFPSCLKKKTVHCGIGIHIICIVPFLPIVLIVPYPFFPLCLKNTVHCGTGICIICIIPILSIVIGKSSFITGQEYILFVLYPSFPSY